jgi:hypothetical protein
MTFHAPKNAGPAFMRQLERCCLGLVTAERLPCATASTISARWIGEVLLINKKKKKIPLVYR